MVKGVGLRRLSCRGSWVQIPPPALFNEPTELFEATCVFAHAKKKGKTSNQEPSIRVASARRKCVALVRHSFFKQLSSMYFWRGRNAPMRRGVLLV